MNHPPADRLLTTGEVAETFRVTPVTVTRWVAAGLIRASRTPGGRLLRYWESDVRAVLAAPAEVAV